MGTLDLLPAMADAIAPSGEPAPFAAPRLVVFTSRLSDSVRRGILEIQRALPAAGWLVVVHQPRKTVRLLVRSQALNLRRNGWRWIPYQTVDAATRVLSALRTRNTDSDPAPWQRAWDDFTRRPEVTVAQVADIHAPATIARVRTFEPGLGLSLAAPILQRSLFGIPRLGTVNLHKGRVPDYRGMPPAFWELWNDAPDVGCTVHRVDDRLDTGDIVRCGSVMRERFSTLRGLQLQLDELGVALMRDAVIDIVAGRSQPVAQPAGGHTYRKPTLSQVADLQRRLAALQPPAQPLVRRVVRDRAAELALWATRSGLASWQTPRITVVLYHRVSDDARDNLTVGIEKFDRQMALLREHCSVLSIEQVLAADTVRRSDRPLVAVTFDDGYLDNFVHAVPILRRHGVPAAFFVSTGMIGEDRRFPHDVLRGNPPIPTMTWAQLRDMRDQGFTIGSHSVSHIDCAAAPKEAVVAELRDSRDELRCELGLSEVVFAYPYGGRHHMTPERLQCVEEAGYVGCLSAYGGSNIGRIDRYDVRRRGIHWEFSERAFLLECLGLR